MAPLDLPKALAFNYMFRGLSEAKLLELTEFALIKDYLGGDLLVRQFDSSSDVLILLEGKAITKTFSGEVVAHFGPGSVIGEVSLIDGQPRSANVVSVGSSKAAILPAVVIRRLMDENAAVGYRITSNIAQVLCRRIRSMNEHADSLVPSKHDLTSV